MKLQASVTPEDATNKTLVYTSLMIRLLCKRRWNRKWSETWNSRYHRKSNGYGKEKTVKVTEKKVEKEPANPAKPSQPTTKTVKKGTKL